MCYTTLEVRVGWAGGANAASVVLAGTLGVEVVGAAVHGKGVGAAFAEAGAEEVDGLSGTEIGPERVAAGVLAVVVLSMLVRNGKGV